MDWCGDGVHMDYKNKKKVATSIKTPTACLSLTQFIFFPSYWLGLACEWVRAIQQQQKKLVTLMYTYVKPKRRWWWEWWKILVVHSIRMQFLFIQNIFKRIPKTFFSLYMNCDFFSSFSSSFLRHSWFYLRKKILSRVCNLDLLLKDILRVSNMQVCYQLNRKWDTLVCFI